MGLFTKTTDYNFILEKILDSKRFSTNVKSLLLSMLYKIETCYNDYSVVKRIGKTKDSFIEDIILIISEHLENINICEPNSEDAKLLKKHQVIAVTNELEKTALAYPTESALLYAISDIEPKYYYIEDYIFKKEFQDMLVEGNNINTIEILEDFSGWSWNPKSITNKEYISNLVYQNLIMLFGYEFLELCKKSQSTNYDIIKVLKERCNSYYEALSEVIYLKNKSKRLENKLEKNIAILKEFENPERLIQKNNKKIESIQKQIEKIESLLKNDKALNKSFLLKNSKLDENKQIRNIETYKKMLLHEKGNLTIEFEKLKKLSNSKLINYYCKKLEFYKRLFYSDKTVEQAVIELEKCFIKILYEKSKEIKTRNEFIDIIYKVRYFRNISFSKEKSVKDIKSLEDCINKLFAKIITFGTENSYMRMLSINVGLNAKIITICLDSRSMELENLKVKIDVQNNKIFGEVYENKIFEKNFEIPVTCDDLELHVKKGKIVGIFI